jgi:hypothetical protein
VIVSQVRPPLEVRRAELKEAAYNEESSDTSGDLIGSDEGMDVQVLPESSERDSPGDGPPPVVI